MTALRGSSSQDGFFQETPTLEPLYTSPRHLAPSQQQQAASTDPRQASDDITLARILHLYLPAAKQEPAARTIHNLSRRALDPDVLAHAVDAEVNRPVLKPFNTFGQENKNDPLWTTSGWRELKNIGHREGVVAVSYEEGDDDDDDDDVNRYNRRVHQFGLSHVWNCTATMTPCPMAMTDGAAKLLRLHLDDADGDQPGLNSVLREAYRRLISRDPLEAWTSGQWMTERTGGSDVSETETIARRLTQDKLKESRGRGRDQDAHGMPLGPWRIDGFKWFSSATDSDATLLLAQTEQGLSLFFAPMRRLAAPSTSPPPSPPNRKPPTELNGIRIQKLKDKIGTKALPTAELELKGARAWRIGKAGSGIREISTILTLTRLHTAAASAAYWGRGLQVSRAYAKVRKVRGGILLRNNPQHVRWMADNAVRYAAAMHLCFLGHAMLGATEQGWDAVVGPTGAAALIPRDAAELAALFRLLTPVIKAQVSVASVVGLREHMEGLGGVGYCENNEDGGLLNISKIFRDNLVSPIWEGTVSVMAEDVVRVMADRRIGGGRVVQNVFAPWVRRVLVDSSGSSKFPWESAVVEERLDALLGVEKRCDKDELLFRGRELLEHLEAIVCSVLLVYDASTDGDEVAAEVARRWVRSKALSGSQLTVASPTSWREESAMDKKIFLGRDFATQTRIMEKL